MTRHNPVVGMMAQIVNSRKPTVGTAKPRGSEDASQAGPQSSPGVGVTAPSDEQRGAITIVNLHLAALGKILLQLGAHAGGDRDPA